MLPGAIPPPHPPGLGLCEFGLVSAEGGSAEHVWGLGPLGGAERLLLGGHEPLRAGPRAPWPAGDRAPQGPGRVTHTVVNLNPQERKQLKQRLPVYEAQVGALEPETESSQRNTRRSGRREQPQIGDPPVSQKAALSARGAGSLHLRKGEASVTVLGCCRLGAASRRDWRSEARTRLSSRQFDRMSRE